MICTADRIIGAGGVAGGAGLEGSVAASNVDTATSTGIPVLKTVSGIPTELTFSLSQDIYGEVPYTVPEGYTAEFIVRPSKTSKEILYNEPVQLDGNSVTVRLSDDSFTKPGLYPAGVVVKDEDGNPVSEHEAYLYVEAGLNLNNQTTTDPISIADVRMALFDFSPEYNTLLNDLEFSDLQIISAIKRPVDEWNSTPPDIRRYTYSNFPWREFWLKGTCSYLLEMAAHRYNRNTMPHNASGLTMDVMNKGGAYLQTALALRQEWKGFIMSKKTELNMADCWGMTSLDVYN